MSQFQPKTEQNLIHSIYATLINTFQAVILLIKNNILLFLVCIGIPFGIGLYKYNNHKNEYKASFTVSYDELVRKIYGDRLSKLNSLAARRDIQKLSAILQVSPTVASKLLQVYGENIFGEDLTQDLNTDKIPFVINLIVSDTSSIAEIQYGVAGFLEKGNAFLKERKTLKSKEVEDELAFIDQQLSMMDSLKRIYNEHPNVGKGDEKSGSSISSLYQFSYELYKRKQEILRKKAMPSNIQIIDDIIIPSQNRKPMLTYAISSIVIGSLSFFLIVLFLLPVIKMKKI